MSSDACAGLEEVLMLMGCLAVLFILGVIGVTVAICWWVWA